MLVVTSGVLATQKIAVILLYVVLHAPKFCFKYNVIKCICKLLFYFALIYISCQVMSSCMNGV